MDKDLRSPTAVNTPLKRHGIDRSEQRRHYAQLPDQAGAKMPIYILRMPALRARIDVSRAAVYDWMNPNSRRYDPTFPVPVKLSAGGAVGWIESEIDHWLESRIRTTHKRSNR